MSNVTVQEALKAAIAALEDCHEEHGVWYRTAIEQCKAALVEIDKREPVAYISNDAKLPLTEDGSYWLYPEKLEYRIALYDKPQPRDWVGLSEEDKKELSHNVYANDHSIGGAITLVESKLKQLNTKG